MRFTKMHGIGNDYVYIDAISQHIQDTYDLPQLANILSDRHTGVGGDGLVLILPSDSTLVR
jgi:diaminopimelate epimerase